MLLCIHIDVFTAAVLAAAGRPPAKAIPDQSGARCCGQDDVAAETCDWDSREFDGSVDRDE